MTFTDIVNAAAGRLNLTSSDATTRLGLYVNERYRRLTSSVGLNTSRRATVTADTTQSDPEVTFALAKIESVYVLDDGARRVLNEITYDQWRNLNVWAEATGDPATYAVQNVGASTVTVVLDPIPSGVITLSADGLAPASTLSGSAVPAFPADFHDALVFGAIADEYCKLEKPALARQFEMQYESRVSDLRYFLAKSAYLMIVQGDDGHPYRRGRVRIVG